MRDETASERAWRDQGAAAAKESLTATARYFDQGHKAGLWAARAIEMAVPSLPDKLRDDYMNTVSPWMEGNGRTCLHNPNFWRPEPVVVAAWRPGLVVCQRCTFLLIATSRDEDRTCDVCNRVVTGPENGDPIYLLSIRMIDVEWVEYQAGACSQCYANATNN